MKRTCRYLLVLFLAIFCIAESNPLTQAESWSDWVSASSAPVGADIRERRWVYNRTTWQDSTNANLDGFAHDGDNWIQSGTGQVNYASFPDGFNTGHWIYTSMAREPYSAYENATNRRIVENSWGGFVYWHWMYRIAGANAYDTENFGLKRAYTNKKDEYISGAGRATEFHAFLSSVNYPLAPYSTSYCNGKGLTSYDCLASHDGWETEGQRRFMRFDYYTSKYTDEYKLFHYKKVETDLVSATEIGPSDVSNGSTRTLIDNVRPQVRYVQSYDISFNANGGSGAPGAMKKQAGINLVLPETRLERVGYVFLGWSMDASASQASYPPGGYFPENRDATLYAVWEARNYGITYHANGDNVQNLPTTQSKRHKEDITLNSNAPERDGFKFLGWATHSDEVSVAYQPGDLYQKDEALNLYAVWYATKHFDVKSDAWHFGNSMKDFGYTTRGPGAAYPIPYSSFVEIFGRDSAKVIYKRITAKSQWGGNCNGMATASALFFTGSSLNSNNFGRDTVYLLELTDTANGLSAKTVIEAMQLSQHTNQYNRILRDNLISNSQIRQGKNLNLMYNTIRDGLKENHCTVVAVQNTFMNAGHALLAYALEEIGEGVRIMVYDCNYPGDENRSILLTRNSGGDFTDWAYEIGDRYGTWGTNSDNECAVSFIPYEAVESVWTRRGSLSVSDLMLMVNSSNLVIRDVAGDEVARLENGVLYSSQADVYSVPNLSLGAEGDLRGIYLPTDYYYVENLEESVTFSASMIGDELSASVTTSAETVSFSMDESLGLNVVLIPDASSDDIFSVEMTNGENNVTLQGEGTGGNISISNSSVNGLDYDNCDMLSIQVDGVEQIHTISATAGPGGTISPAGDSRVEAGASLAYNIVPGMGFKIYQVLIDGVSIGNPDSYTFHNISGNHTITVTFVHTEILSASVYKPDNLVMFTYTSNRDIDFWAVLYSDSGQMMEVVTKGCSATSSPVTDVLRFEQSIPNGSVIKLFAMEAGTKTMVCPPKSL